MRRPRPVTRVLLGTLALTGALALAACGEAETDGAAQDAAEPGGVYRVGTTDLGFSGGFDPAAEYTGIGWGIHQQLLVRALLGYRHTAGAAGTEIIPDLAEAVPEPTDGGRTWTFRIREGVRFAPPVNRAVTSRDVAHAFERMATPSVAAQYSFYYSAIRGFDAFSEGKATSISGIRTPDARTIVFTLTEPVPDFTYRLAMPATAPVPREVARCHTGAGEYGRYVVASGPYMLAGSEKLDITSCATMKPVSGFRPSRGITLVRNPNYDPATDSPEQRSALPDRFEFIVNTNEKDIFDKIEAGEYEGSYDAVPADVAARYSRDEERGDRLRSNVDDGIRALIMNVAEPPFDDVNVRRAVNLVLDKDGMRRAYGGPFYGEIAGHITPNALFGEDPRVVGYDPYATPDSRGDVEAARAAMRESRYDTDRDGVCDAGACKGVLFVNRNESPYPKLTPVVRESLAKIGITLEVKELPTGASYDAVGAPKNRVQLMANVVWGKDFPDPTTYMVLFDGRNIIDSGNSANALVGLTEEQATELGIPYPAGGVPSVDDRITECNGAAGAARRDCFIALEKTLMEEVVPWAPYMFSANTDLLGPAVTRWDFDQFSGEAALAHVAVDPSKQ